jgi:glyoxylate/hydroxypyruvate reductase
MPLQISVCFAPDSGAERWAQALAAAPALQRWQPSAHVWRAEAPHAAPPADYAVVWRPPQAFFDAQPGLKGIFNAGAGVDALHGLQLPAGAALVRLVDAGMASQMADHALWAVLHHQRRMDVYQAQAAAGQWLAHAPQDKADWPVGVLGFGALGQVVAPALAQRGFAVRAWARQPRGSTVPPGLVGAVHHGPAGLADLLRASRVLICLLPLTAATHGLLNRSNLALLQPGALLVNLARGGHVVQADLLAALDDPAHPLDAAVLDVCEPEPAPPDHPLWRHPRITLTPHIAAATLRAESVAQMAQGMAALQRGERPRGWVDRSIGY